VGAADGCSGQTIILGAGASRPCLLPTSGELRHILLGGSAAADAFKSLGFGDIHPVTNRYDGYLQSAFSADEIGTFRKEFFDSQRVSIDLFLSRRKDDFEAIGKLAIATAILMCERALHVNENWYQWLLERLIRDGPELESEKLYIVTFNYDRSFEFFLWRAFRAAFKLSNADTDKMLRHIEIVHVYGDVGPLFGTPEEVVPFGEPLRAREASRWINVVAPNALPSTTKRVREIVSECERICFLGFGFWRENVDVLGLEITARKNVFASCFGLPRGTKNDILHHFGTKSLERPTINFGGEDQDVMKFLTHWNVL
jgi:hypothetical protein